jgi:hypothetical protein
MMNRLICQFFILAWVFTVNSYAQLELKRSSFNVLDQRRAGASAVLDGSGAVSSITLRGGGMEYTDETATVTLTAPVGGGITATAIATVSNGEITGFTITNAGSGYGSIPPEVFIAAPQAVVGDVATTPQFAGMAALSASAGPLDGPAGVIPLNGNTRYPGARDFSVPAVPVITMVLDGASYGYAFSAGVPLYALGDVISPPVVAYNGLQVAEGYWRSRPVGPGEVFPSGSLRLGDPETGNIVAQPVLEEGTVTVTKSSTTSQEVTVASVPASLTPGAILLGQKVGLVNGTTVLLVGNASRNITLPGVIEKISPYQSYYYSPHADKVFASQTGQVTITWVSRSPDTSRPGETEPSYKFRRETFNVSSGTTAPVRTIYWTEGSKGFNGPLVNIPSGRVKRVNPVYNHSVPAMAPEYVAVGGNTNPNPNVNPATETRTLWFDNQSGQAALRAHNLEGRVFVEYLGNESNSTTGTLEFLGADIVEIQRVAEVETVDTWLGEKLRPRPAGKVQSGDDQLIPLLSNETAVVTTTSYGTHIRPDGTADYTAERESLDPSAVSLYWMQQNDPGVRPAAPALAIRWPLLKRNYTFSWPAAIGEFVPVNVPASTTGRVEGPRFVASSLPSIVFQDDPAGVEAAIDGARQRLTVQLAASGDQRNRSLLKFSTTAEPYYLRLWIQSEDALGSPFEPDPDGLGPAVEKPAVYTLNDLDANAVRDFAESKDLGLPATVGTRLEPPSADLELAGHLSSGDCYSAMDYLSPLADEGMEAAAAGAIIPVNSRPGRHQDHRLKVWWFKKIVPTNSNVAPFYVPAVAVNYEVGFPAAQDAEDLRDTLVIASGKGLETPLLTSVQAVGKIYVQNDAALPGYNPNEEHALMLNENVYALRSDLNDAATTSKPFVLVSYMDSTNRPAMRALRVRSHNTRYPLRFGQVAGTPLQPPMPLTVMPLPLQADGSVRNSETAPNDNAPGNMAPTGAAVIVDYHRFSFVDRKGMHWLYRGPHAGVASDAGFNMRFFYKSLEGFFVPGLANQPAVGTIMPFIAAETGANKVSGEAVSIRYLPRWPSDSAIPVLETGRTLTLAANGLPQVRGQTSAQLLYQQSIANTTSAVSARKASSVLLHDSTRKKVFPLGAANALEKLPTSVLVSDYAGRTYFQGLPPHLQKRFYFDPNEGTQGKGALVLIGEFYDEPTGEDYLDLNALGDADRRDLKALCTGTDEDLWGNAIDAMATTLETSVATRRALATATLAAGRVTAGGVTAAGFGYSEAPMVTLDAPPVGGTRATATANYVRASGTITGITITNAGSGYLTAPQITISPPSFNYVIDPSKNVICKTADLCEVSDPNTAVDSYALSTTGMHEGYVTLAFGNGGAFTDEGDPVSLQILKVSRATYPGDLKVRLGSNPLDEQLTLQHSGDYGGESGNFEFKWLYTTNNGAADLPTAAEDGAPGWFAPDGDLGSRVKVGGSSQAVPAAVLMGDSYFTMKMRPKGGAWSEWTEAVLVEGWIKRVLAKITPFNQRMTDLYNNGINSDVSLLTQAGRRWEGDIALNLENINEVGLIEIYETILNRGKTLTIVPPGVASNASNNALLLAAGYLNDLYTVLGNEAFADAANPTISVDDKDTVTEVNTSRFAFEGQVASSLDEELGLLRGRDDFNSPSTATAPAYNRLYWNYTRGINSGEALYAVNYNIKEKSGTATTNGIVDAADAQRMFPQGHGDAYGHYLTALTGYYKLLTHPNFSWIPQSEDITVLGQAVRVDYKDERKFTAAAANVAASARQILDLVHRQSYQDAPTAGWAHFRDGAESPRTKRLRHQGLDETASRSGQGAFFHWVTGNAMLPSEDRDPSHSGVEIVDRTTVPELNSLIAAVNSFQSTVDNANARLNPLGLSPGAISFDLDPVAMAPAGGTQARGHYRQIADRAISALNNAAGSFNQAASMTRLLRNQENNIADKQDVIFDQERTYVNQLKAIYGMPYAGDVGAGKTYQQGYDGPDLERWWIIDRPTDLVDTRLPVTVSLRVPGQVEGFTGNAIDDIQSSYNNTATVLKTLQIQPSQYAQFADLIGPGTALGRRPEGGALQDALMEAQVAQVALISANDNLQILQQRFKREGEVFEGMVSAHRRMLASESTNGSLVLAGQVAAAVLESFGEVTGVAAEHASDIADAGASFMPLSVGFSNDVTSSARGAIKLIGTGTKIGLSGTAAVANSSARLITAGSGLFELVNRTTLMSIGFSQEELQGAYEFEQTYHELSTQAGQFYGLMATLDASNQKIRNLIAEGNSLQAEREAYRQRAAAFINGYRTKDLTFRAFRNEALEQYRDLFDLASRYTYLAAKSYDYETGLLGTTQGQRVFGRIVASRSLGDLGGGVPKSTSSTLGDAGLAGTMAQLESEYSVASGRLGLNNPDHYNTLFSLRQELFRVLNVGTTASDDEAWQQVLEQHILPDVLADPDVGALCRNLKKPDGSRVPGIVIPFSSTIEAGKNFFGLELSSRDHAYSVSSFATKIAASGIAFPGYVGIDPPDASTDESKALSATPYVYLIPCGEDSMRAPPFGDQNLLRSWRVVDQALPLPYNLGGSDFNGSNFLTAKGTLSEAPWVIRKHQAFRAVSDTSLYLSGDIPLAFSNARLIGRSVWNSKWKIVIPANTLLANEQEGLNRFVASVKDVQLFLRTYSNAGN